VARYSQLFMLIEIILEAWIALKRNVTRSFLTMLGIVWGIATVTLLIAYGSSFRSVLVHGFDAFGKGAVICWPQQTSEQPGGQRAGKKVVLEQADLDMVKQTASLVKHVCLETVRRPGIAYGDRLVGTAPVRGVCPEYGEMRNEVPSEGRWINAEDELERRRVIFLGGRLREELFSGRPAVGETVQVSGVRFTVIGVMARKIQLSNYFSSDDESSWIPYSTAGDLWNTRYAAVMVFEPIAPQFEKKAMAQVLAAVATRQNFSPTDPKAIQMFGRDEFRPVIDALTIGLQVLLTFIGTLTLGIGGVGVMNIMLVSVDERIREIGLRRAHVVPAIETSYADVETANVSKRRIRTGHGKRRIVEIAVHPHRVLLEFRNRVFAIRRFRLHYRDILIFPVHDSSGMRPACLQAGAPVKNDHHVLAQVARLFFLPLTQSFAGRHHEHNRDNAPRNPEHG